MVTFESFAWLFHLSNVCLHIHTYVVVQMMDVLNL